MKLSSLSALVMCCAMIASCTDGKKQGEMTEGIADPIDYTLTVTNIDAGDSTMAYLYDYDALAGMRNLAPEALVDSAYVMDSVAKFNVNGSTAPVVLFTVANNGRRCLVFPEAGENNYDFDTSTGSGTLAKKFASMRDSLNAVALAAEGNIPDPGTAEYDMYVDSVMALLNTIKTDVMNENLNNGLGYYMAVSMIPDMKSEDLDSLVARAPRLANGKQIQNALEGFKKLAATSAGCKYTDFTIDNDSVKVSLSEYVKPGQYTLVDFWASWCGPCKRAIASLKQNYEELSNKGLNVVGVAVWEDAEATRAWLADNPLPWPIILDAQTVPTDLYAIKGIPTMLLISPDGIILCRSYSDEEVLEAFEKAIGESK